jgi:hypothetical protein
MECVFDAIEYHFFYYGYGGAYASYVCMYVCMHAWCVCAVCVCDAIEYHFFYYGHGGAYVCVCIYSVYVQICIPVYMKMNAYKRRQGAIQSRPDCDCLHTNTHIHAYIYTQKKTYNKNAHKRRLGAIPPQFDSHILHNTYIHTHTKRTHTNAGLEPYHPNLTATFYANISSVDQDDHPFSFTTTDAILFQNASAEIYGIHMADLDTWEYASKGALKYEGTFTVDQGLVTIPVLKTRCRVTYVTARQVGFVFVCVCVNRLRNIETRCHACNIRTGEFCVCLCVSRLGEYICVCVYIYIYTCSTHTTYHITDTYTQFIASYSHYINEYI